MPAVLVPCAPPLARRVQVTRRTLQQYVFLPRSCARVIFQNSCGHYDDKNFATRKLLRRSHSSSSCFFSFTFAHSSASAGAGLRSMIGFHFAASSRFFAMNACCASGTSSSAKIASTGHSGTHSVQSMHSSGSITSMLGPSRKQSTGHTSTQSVYLHLIQDSVTT